MLFGFSMGPNGSQIGFKVKGAAFSMLKLQWKSSTEWSHCSIETRGTIEQRARYCIYVPHCFAYAPKMSSVGCRKSGVMERTGLSINGGLVAHVQRFYKALITSRRIVIIFPIDLALELHPFTFANTSKAPFACGGISKCRNRVSQRLRLSPALCADFCCIDMCK